MSPFLSMTASLATDDPGSLDRLADIVTAPPAPWWPPAPGWVLLAVLLLAAGLWRLAKGAIRWRENAYRRAGLEELERIARESERVPERLREVPVLLKRMALAAAGRPRVAGLSGPAWLRFLSETSADGTFPAKAGDDLESIAYDPAAPGKLSRPDRNRLLAAAEEWIRHHRAEATSPSSGEPAPC